jgi:hypothetical protein
MLGPPLPNPPVGGAGRLDPASHFLTQKNWIVAYSIKLSDDRTTFDPASIYIISLAFIPFS